MLPLEESVNRKKSGVEGREAIRAREERGGRVRPGSDKAGRYLCLTLAACENTISAMLSLIMGGIWLFAPAQDDEDVREKLKDPANVWPLFQARMKAGQYSKAHDLLAPATRKFLPYEAFFIAFASYEAPRHLVAQLTPLRAEEGKLLLCSYEFGARREIRLTKYLGRVWTLEFTPDDIEFFKGRTLAWFRHQVSKADGWHFAYPPDWTYAPLARTDTCKK
jgi:hypothetical protein